MHRFTNYLAKLRSGDAKPAAPTATAAAKSDSRFPAVDIDTGRFKYVLIEVTDPDGNTFHLVRGHAGPAYGYHYNVATPTVNKLKEAGWKHEVLGGGRIDHNAETKNILVYGARPNACSFVLHLLTKQYIRCT